MKAIKFRIAAKTDVGIVRTNNEDNFQASSDLSENQMRWINNETCSLSDKGALLVVADGMGGANAGEVASELAIETIKEFFSPAKITPEVIKTRYTIEKYMNDAIVAADMKIKAEAKTRPETKGMGTTIVIGWIIDGKLYLSWCGDSRAYIYNPSAGLHQISKDHSYVQNLVDKGSITREEAFYFPDSNIITRCLSDGTTKAQPESLLKPYEICDNDIIMLCTDGLSGMIQDKDIEAIIRKNEHNMDILADDLIKAACEAEGSDNITICLCQILQGGGICNPSVFNDYDKRLNGSSTNFIRTLINKPEKITSKNRNLWIICIIGVIIVLIGSIIGWFVFREKSTKKAINETPSETVQSFEPKHNAAIVNKSPEAEPTSPSIEEAGKISKTNATGKENKNGTIFQKGTADDEIESNKEDDEIVLTPLSDKNEHKDQNNTELSKIKTQKYKVLKGDTYYSLAQKFNTKIEILKNINNNVELKAGEIINVPK